MNIRGMDLAFDPFDADTIDLVERECKKLARVANWNTQNQKESDTIRALCRKVFAFFDAVFGQGTAKNLFGNKYSLTDCMGALEEFLNQKNAQEQTISAQFEHFAKLANQTNQP